MKRGYEATLPEDDDRSSSYDESSCASTSDEEAVLIPASAFFNIVGGSLPSFLQPARDLPAFVQPAQEVPPHDQQLRKFRYHGVRLDSVRWTSDVYPPMLYSRPGQAGGSSWMHYGPPYQYPFGRIAISPKDATSPEHTEQRCRDNIAYAEAHKKSSSAEEELVLHRALDNAAAIRAQNDLLAGIKPREPTTPVAEGSTVAAGAETGITVAAGAETGPTVAAGAETGPTVAAGAETGPTVAAGAETGPTVAAGAETGPTVAAGAETGPTVAAGAETGPTVAAGAETGPTVAAGTSTKLNPLLDVMLVSLGERLQDPRVFKKLELEAKAKLEVKDLFPNPTENVESNPRPVIPKSRAKEKIQYMERRKLERRYGRPPVDEVIKRDWLAEDKELKTVVDNLVVKFEAQVVDPQLEMPPIPEQDPRLQQPAHHQRQDPRLQQPAHHLGQGPRLQQSPPVPGQDAQLQQPPHPEQDEQLQVPPVPQQDVND